MAKTGWRGSWILVAPICLNLGMTAPVLSWVITCLGRMVMKSPERAELVSPTACLVASFSMRVRVTMAISCRVGRVFEAHHLRIGGPRRLGPPYKSILLPQHLRDIEIDEVRVVEDDALDCPLHFVPFV